MDVSSEMIHSLLPVFMVTSLGVSVVLVGFLDGLAEATALVVKIFSGAISDYFGKRKWLAAIGYGMSAVTKPLFALATSFGAVFFARMADRVGKGVRGAPRDALIADVTPAELRGAAYGLRQGLDTIGAFVGPLLAFALMSASNDNFKLVFWIAVIPAVLSVLAVTFIKDHEPHTRRMPKPQKNHDGTKTPETLAHESSQKLSPRLNRLIILLSTFAVFNFPDALLILHISQIGFSVTDVVGIYLLFNICYAALSLPVGMLADRMKPQHVYAIGLLCFAIAYGGLGLTRDFALTIILVAIYGGFAAANDVVGKSWVSKLAGDNQQMKVQARLQGLTGFGILIAGIWAGLTWNLGDGAGTVPLLISGAVGLAAAALISRFKTEF